MGRRSSRKERLYATARILGRAWQLYVAHIFLFVMFIAEVSYTVTTFNNPMYNDEMRVGDFLDEPHVAIVKALLLEFQPTFLDILPLYILLLVIFPVVLLGLRSRPLIVLCRRSCSISSSRPPTCQFRLIRRVMSGISTLSPGNFCSSPELRSVSLAARAAVVEVGSAGIAARRGLFVAAGFIIKLSWTIHGIWDPFPGLLLKELWPVNKNNLSPIRVIPFFAAVAVVAVVVPANAAILRSPAAKPLVLCGQQSLEIFCLGILLSALGHFVLSEYDSAISIQLLVNLAGILVMCLTARMLDWYKTMGRTQAPRFAAPQTGRGNRLGK